MANDAINYYPIGLFINEYIVLIEYFLIWIFTENNPDLKD